MVLVAQHSPLSGSRMNCLPLQYIALCLFCAVWRSQAFRTGGRGLCGALLKRPSIATKAFANEAVVGSLDLLRKHLMEKTVCLAVFPKSAFPGEKISALRTKFAGEHTWNSFLTKDQLTKLVMGKYYCPVLEYATAENWCIFMEQKRVDAQYKKLTRFISMEYELSPQPVDEEGQPIYTPGEVRHKFMFCKKFHMILLDGVKRSGAPGSGGASSSTKDRVQLVPRRDGQRSGSNSGEKDEDGDYDGDDEEDSEDGDDGEGEGDDDDESFENEGEGEEGDDEFDGFPDEDEDF